MAVTLTKNLGLRIDSGLSADAKFNLKKIDELAATFLPNSIGVATIRSKEELNLEPNSPDIGGSGTGGVINFGTVDSPLSEVNINAAVVNSSGASKWSDQAGGGSFGLSLAYHSDLSGAAEAVSDRVLKIDVDGADRELILGGNLSVIGNLSLTIPADLSLTLPADTGLVGQVLTTDGEGVLSWTDAAATNLESLVDVDLTSPSEDDHLVYDSGLSLWRNVRTRVSEDWVNSDGTVKTITHNLGSQGVVVQVLDIDDEFASVEVDRVARPNANQVVLTSPVAPSGSGWRIIISRG